MKDDAVIFQLVKLFTTVTPTLLTIRDTHHLIIDSVLDFSISNDIDYVAEYLASLQSFEKLESDCQIKALEPHEFEKYVQHLQNNGNKPQSLTAIKCQVLFGLVSEKSYSAINYLKLKVKFMPNLMRVQHLPPYVIPILASSLKEAKSETDLQAMFSSLKKEQIDRVFLLSILTDIADMNTLLVSHKDKQHLENIDKHKNDHLKSTEYIKEKDKLKAATKELKRAMKTGFLSRLLKKLSF